MRVWQECDSTLTPMVQCKHCVHLPENRWCKKVNAECRPDEWHRCNGFEKKGEWDWKLRHRGGFRRYTGVDDFGVEHTITVDERFECYDPYCHACGKLNESIYLNFCPNCGKEMLQSDPPFVRRKPPKGE